MPQSESDRLFEMASRLAVHASDLERVAAWLRAQAEERVNTARRLQQEEAEKG